MKAACSMLHGMQPPSSSNIPLLVQSEQAYALFAALRGQHTSAPDNTDEPLAVGDVVGRYVIAEIIGRGGMGMVYAAHDPELDRKVALKVVLPYAGVDKATVQTRLVREARALARLSHPHVVSIHDVGTFGSRVWLAMELVIGKTLRAWSAERPRRWSETLGVLLDAARGIVAAHTAGLVHRDLKPENVMIGGDGRVRVMDFGLAHATLCPPEATITVDTCTSTVLPSQPRTVSGTLLGTPGYMAPEQWQRRDARAAADQFSWAVMAWELLYGERPFPGATLLDLADNVVSGRRRAPPAGSDVPRWLRGALERALHPDPARRWPTMASLVAALEPIKGSWRRIALLAATATILVGAAVMQGRDPTSACRLDRTTLTGVWDDTRRAALHAHGDDANWRSIASRLDHYADTLLGGQMDACVAHARREDSDLLFERRRSCLTHRRSALQGVASGLTDGAPASLERAWSAVEKLPAVEMCANREAMLRAVMPPDAEIQAAVAAVESRLHALGAGDAAEPAAARTALQELEAEAREIGYQPLVAALLVQRANLEWLAEEPAMVCEHLLSAYTLAEAAGDDATAARCTMGMISRCGAPGEGRAQHVGVLVRMARSKLERAGLLGGSDHIQMLQNVAWEAVSRSDYVEAERTIEEAVTLVDAVTTMDPLLVADTHADRAKILLGQYGKWWDPRVERSLTTALEACVQVLDPDSATCIDYLLELGTVRAVAGDAVGARTLLERPLAMLAREPGKNAASLKRAVDHLLKLGRVYTILGDLDQAGECFLRAQQIHPQSSGPFDSAKRSLIEMHLGHLAEREHDAPAAIRHYQAALDLGGSAAFFSLSEQIRVVERLLALLEKQGSPDLVTAMRKRRDELVERVYAEGGLTFAGVEKDRGVDALVRGAWPEAAQIYGRMACEVVRLHGSSHPEAIAARARLASVQLGLEKCTASRAIVDEMAAAYRRAPSDPLQQLLDVYLVRSIVHACCGDLATAEAALAELEPALREGGPPAKMLTDVVHATLHIRRGQLREALVYVRRNVRFMELARFGDNGQMLGGALAIEAEVVRRSGEPARDSAQRALRLLEEAFGSEHIALAAVLTTLSHIELAEGDMLAAELLATRALTIREANGSDAQFMAESRFALAEALARRPEQRTQAMAMARQARAEYQMRGDLHGDEVEAIDRWLGSLWPESGSRLGPDEIQQEQ